MNLDGQPDGDTQQPTHDYFSPQSTRDPCARTDGVKPAVTVAIVAFPETSASVVYGLYDLFSSAGRDWGVLVNGIPGKSLMKPVVEKLTSDDMIAIAAYTSSRPVGATTSQAKK